MRGDRPLGVGDEDQLGFREVAQRIASSLIDHASDNGLVIGLEGAWGSGKSSLLYLIEDELAKLGGRSRPSVIHFRPWLVGNRDALLASLFSSLQKEINVVTAAAGDVSGISKEKAKAAGEALRKFAEGLGGAGSAVELAGEAIAFPPLKWFGKGLKALGSLAKRKGTTPSLEVLKKSLVLSLRELGHRFVITIDDVDRLEPGEVLEVLRLARSVADLPNVVYLLCYDREILAHSIEQASRVKNGSAYLEKIVQLTVMVPKPEPFRLRQWFSDELRVFTSTKSDDELARLKSVVDFEGGRQLRTPRSVVRALDSIRFFWPPLRDARGDLADLVWLQLIKDGNPALYRWIEEYSATAALMSIGTVTVSAAERGSELQALNDLGGASFADHAYRFHFAEPLPGADVDYDENGGTFHLYERVAEAERNDAIARGRLASPDHYRLYFALSGPSHALTQGQFDAFWDATLNSADDVADVLLQLHQSEVIGNVGKADLLLERLKSADDSVFSAEASQTILVGLAQVMDSAYLARPFDIDWALSLWDRAIALTRKLMARLDPDSRMDVIDRMFGDGAAIGWLTKLMRKDTFAHGRYGDRAKPVDEWLFSGPELDRIFYKMLDRFRAMSVEQLLNAVRPLDVLFAWKQAGDETGPRDFLSRYTVTDDGLVQVLERLTSIHTSSDRGSYSVLSRDNVAPFVDFAEANSRIDRLSQTEGPLMTRACKLKQAFDDASW